VPGTACRPKNLRARTCGALRLGTPWNWFASRDATQTWLVECILELPILRQTRANDDSVAAHHAEGGLFVGEAPTSDVLSHCRLPCSGPPRDFPRRHGMIGPPNTFPRLKIYLRRSGVLGDRDVRSGRSCATFCCIPEFAFHWGNGNTSCHYS
jgi:hypothetical protein